MKQSVVVIGGGVAGIVAAFRLASLGNKVLLVERANSLGGLLQSRCINGRYYDFGTHFLSKTSIADLDTFLFDGLNTRDLIGSSVASFNRTLHNESGFLHDFGFPDNVRKTFLDSYLSLNTKVRTSASFNNLADQLTYTFGPLIYDNLLEPSLIKFFHTSPVNLAPDSHRLFGLHRIILGDPETIRNLKMDLSFDRDLAFHSHQEGSSSHASSFYPLHGGVGAWPKLLTEKLRELNVEIVTNAQYTLTHSKNRISQIDLCGNCYDLDLVVSTIPLGPLCKSLYPPPAYSAIKPTFLSTILVHFEYPADYCTDSLYVNNYDPSHHSFRVSLYGNYLRSVAKQSNHLTVEFLVSDTPASIKTYCDYAKVELQQMNLLTSPELATVVGTDLINTGFPVPSPTFSDLHTKSSSIPPLIDNLISFGRSSGKSWFMSDVISQIYHDLN